MYVRATTINADTSRLEEGIAFVRDNVVPAVETLPGSLGLSMFVNHETGVTTVSTGWETEQSRAAADNVLTPLRAKGTRILGAGTPVTELFDLAVLDRLRPAQPGFYTRMTRVDIDAKHVDEAVDAYASSTLHDLQVLPGYCSAVLLIDRDKGAGVVSVTFDSLATLEASRERGEQIRRSGLEKTGARSIDVRESEIVIAGIRLPQSG